MVLAYVGLGANLGDASARVRWAIDALGEISQTVLLRYSSLYRSAPVQASGPDFINAVAAIQTGLTAPTLLQQLQQLEQVAGRLRPFHHAPRTLDLDLLIYGNASIDSPTLQLPHPRLYQRAFVLAPLAEIEPSLVSAEQWADVSSQQIERLG